MKRLIFVIMMVCIAIASYGTATYLSSGIYTIASDATAQSLTAAAIADSTAGISDRWLSETYKGDSFMGKVVTVKGVVGTACKATDASTAVNHLTPVIQISDDGTYFYDYSILSWVNTVSSGTTLAATASAYAVFVADLRNCTARYFRIAWMAETAAHAVTINARYGTIKTTVTTK